MDFGVFFLVAFLGIASVGLIVLAVAVRLVSRKFAKIVLVLAAASVLLFLALAGWTLYVYGLNEPLATAAGEGNITEVKFLLGLGASPNAIGVDNMYTALTAASEAGRTEIVNLLLQRGADPSRKDGEGNTPLECAKRNGHEDIVRLLQQAQRKK